MVRIDPHERNNLGKISVVDAFQVRSVSRDRLARKIGVVSEREFARVLDALKIVLGIG